MQVGGGFVPAMHYKSIKSQVRDGRVSCSRNHPCVLHAIASLSRRDVDFPIRDVDFVCLCHVATWIPTSRRQFCMSLPRRDVDLHVATSVFTTLCHVATWTYTSQRQFLQASVTSRRCPSRRDVSFYKSLSRRDATPHVVTSLSYMLSNVATLASLLSVTSRRHPARRDVALF